MQALLLHKMCAVLGIVAVDLLAGKYGIQQLSLGSVRELGSRVVRRATAANDGGARRSCQALHHVPRLQ